MDLINSYFNFSWSDLAAVDWSQPASWLLVGEAIALFMVAWHLAKAFLPYTYVIDAKIDEWADKLLERLGINPHDE